MCSGAASWGFSRPILLRAAEESGEEVVFLGGQVGWTFIGFGGLPETIAMSFVLGAIIVWGFVRTVRERATVAEFLVPISLLITLLWPFWSFRFVLPLDAVSVSVFRERPDAACCAPASRCSCVIGLNVYDHAGYIAQARSEPARMDWIARFQELDTTLDWMKAHLDRGAVVAATNPAIVHLWTGHKTITLDRVTEPGASGRTGVPVMRRASCRHELPSPWQGSYRLLYQSHPERPRSYWVIDLRLTICGARRLTKFVKQRVFVIYWQSHPDTQTHMYQLDTGFSLCDLAWYSGLL